MLLRESLRSACDHHYRRNALRTVISITKASGGGGWIGGEWESRQSEQAVMVRRLWTRIYIHHKAITNREAVSVCGNELEHLRSTQQERVFPVSWRRKDLRAFDRAVLRDNQLDRARSHP